MTGQKPDYFVLGWTLQRTSDSPPLSKLITGIFIHTLSVFGVTKPIPIRLHCSILLSGTSVICYSIAKKLGDESTGLLAWFLVTIQPILQPEGAYLFLSSLDITCIFFLSLSAYYLLQDNTKGLVLTGIFFGLATLSKYVAFVILPPFILTWTMLNSRNNSEAIKKTAIATGIGLILHLLFNPMITVPTLRETMINWQIREGNVHFQWSADRILLLQAFMGKSPLDVSLTRFMLKMYSLPIQLIAGYYLMSFTLLTIFYAAYNRITLSREELFPLLWFFFTFLFLELHWKHHSYYKLLLFPSLAIFTSLFWINREKIHRRLFPDQHEDKR
jgi:4-amino-4-deoxy-L-arabinose transferase-like glycosyltransferase